MFCKALYTAGALTLAMAVCTPANAATYLLTYQDASHGTFLRAHLSSTPASGDSLLVTSLTGRVFHEAITLDAPGTCCGTRPNDNLLFPNNDGGPSGGFVDDNGLGFNGGGEDFNLFFSSSTGYNLIVPHAGISAGGTATLSVPETATWAMLLIGLGGLGGLLRTRRRQATALA
jgi:hypothetical protein